MPNVILNETAQGQIAKLLNQLPISHLSQAQEIMQVLNSNVETATEEPKPIGGGDGTAKPPRPKDE